MAGQLAQLAASAFNQHGQYANSQDACMCIQDVEYIMQFPLIELMLARADDE